jgi:hypothetical protein
MMKPDLPTKHAGEDLGRLGRGQLATGDLQFEPMKRFGSANARLTKLPMSLGAIVWKGSLA